jgi:peroxiredoxin
LRRWESLLPEFEKLGVRMVALSPDTVAEAARMKAKLGLSMTLLSDASLAVTDRYGLRHAKAFAPKHGPIRPLAIPTTILIDEDFAVRWIDQAEDYRVRSDADRVLAAVSTALSTSGPGFAVNLSDRRVDGQARPPG